jgi:hypothetical protein
VDQDLNNKEARYAVASKAESFNNEEFLTFLKIEISRFNGDCGLN